MIRKHRPSLTALLVAALLVATLLPLCPDEAFAWDKKNADKTQFILRSPAGKIAEVAAKYGLTVLENLSETDANQDVALVGGDPSMTPEQTVELVEPDADVSGIESVELASLPRAVLDQSTASILEAAARQGLYADGQIETFFAGSLWAGYADQPAVQLLRLHEAHANGSPGAAYGSGIVAVIDNGVDPDHPLLQGALVSGYDFITDQPGIPSEWSNLDPTTAAELQQSTASILEAAETELLGGQGSQYVLDQSTASILEQSTASILEQYDLPPSFGHGTMVAGLIRLVAPKAKIMPIRAFDGEGTGSLFDVVRAIHFAVDNGAQVINLSFSTEAYSAEMARAINYAHRKGAVCVAAAGNRSERAMTYPAAFGNSVGVASTTESDEMSAFSNFGSDLVSLAAPGEALITTFPGGSYAAAWGTSFSAPLVSGTIALLHDTTGNGQIKSASDFYQALYALSKGAIFLPELSSELGMGRLDVAEAVANNLNQ